MLYRPAVAFEIVTGEDGDCRKCQPGQRCTVFGDFGKVLGSSRSCNDFQRGGSPLAFKTAWMAMLKLMLSKMAAAASTM